MSRVVRTIEAPPEQVWKVLTDGWLYPVWVVGASRMRDVDAEWPRPGSRLHHSVGVWPVLINDPTEVVDAVPNVQVRLHAHGWPLGSAEVTITLESADEGTRVVIEEDVIGGLGRFVPGPVRALGLRWRNTETLERLAYVVENRDHG